MQPSLAGAEVPNHRHPKLSAPPKQASSVVSVVVGAVCVDSTEGLMPKSKPHVSYASSESLPNANGFGLDQIKQPKLEPRLSLNKNGSDSPTAQLQNDVHTSSRRWPGPRFPTIAIPSYRRPQSKHRPL